MTFFFCFYSYTDQNVYLQTIPINYNDEKDGGLIGISNFSDFVFQLWPKLNYEA